MQEKVEITTNYVLQFWTKIPKKGYCDMRNMKCAKLFLFVDFLTISRGPFLSLHRREGFKKPENGLTSYMDGL